MNRSATFSYAIWICCVDELQPRAPIYELLGLTVTVTSPGCAEGTMIVTEKHFSEAQRMHGGLVFVVFDTVMGQAVHSLIEADIDIATIDMQQRFIRMVDKGPLRVTAEVFHPGRRVMQIRGEAFEHRGKLAATATASFIVLADRKRGDGPVRSAGTRSHLWPVQDA